MSKKTHRILHIKKDCISCGACAAIAPEFWEMDEHGLSHLIGSEMVNGNEEMDIDQKDVELNQDAADACPVNIIHVKKKEK